MKTRFLIVLLGLIAVFLLVGSLSAQDTAAPFLGLEVAENDAGVQVLNVVPDSAADAAGVESDDVLTAVNGDAVTSYDSLVEALSSYAVGDTVTLDLLRGEEELSLDATLQARPAVTVGPRIQINPRAPLQSGNRAFLGVNLNFTSVGVIVESVEPDSPAADAGLLEGDRINAVDDTAISVPADVAAAIRDLNPGDTVTLSISRDDDPMEIEVTLGERAAQPIIRGDFGANLNHDIVIFDGQSWQIMALSDSSALAEAGLQAGDVITAVDGETMDPAALADHLNGLADDASVSLSVTRGDESLDISVSAADLAAFNRFGFSVGGPRNFDQMPFGMFQGNSTYLGVEFQMLNADVAAEHDLDVTEGALVSSVVADSPAADADLQVDDVIVAVDGDVVDAQRTLRERLYAYDPGDTVTLDVLRGGENLSLDVTLGSLADAHMGMGMMPFFFGPDGQDGRGPRFFFGPNGNGNGPQPGNPNGNAAPQTEPQSNANI